MSLGLLLLLFQAAPQAADAAPTWLEPAQPGRTIFADFIGLHAKVGLLCDLPVSGQLENCTVVSAIPEGAGYEDVALEGAKNAKLTPKITGGKPVPTTIRFTMNFPETEPFPPYTGPAPSEEAMALARPIAAHVLRSQGSGKIVADVASDRRALVQSWIDETLPPNPEGDLQRVTLQFARVMTLEQLKNMNAGRAPGGTPPDFVTLNAAQDPDPRLIKASAELRERYCAQFDCRDPFKTQ